MLVELENRKDVFALLRYGLMNLKKSNKIIRS